MSCAHVTAIEKKTRRRRRCDVENPDGRPEAVAAAPARRHTVASVTAQSRAEKRFWTKRTAEGLRSRASLEMRARTAATEAGDGVAPSPAAAAVPSSQGGESRPMARRKVGDRLVQCSYTHSIL